ncbi:GGDEF domain-containing protein [Vibrio sonorensis]|uniref:GGDEF domain-containing protein n=1 Tax=Vibrio sonorensis TaxID=1004316 RepID=UPI0008DAED17|nr:sensor domain-containing diguanylate cyclase [Vibrio sonorensis]
MQKPPFPDNEDIRLQNLRNLEVLDTAHEERFDRVTRLAKRLFDVPISLVSLVDSDRQWFKSCFGLPVSETPRDISFCGHAILSDQPFVIENTLEDSRFLDNPLVVSEPHIRFYAGVPLVYEDGSVLGTLCIIDTEPREFGQESLQDLIDLAKMAERELCACHTASLDELTGISNRRGFIELANKSLNYCTFAHFPYSLAYFDLNDLKAINDSHGHQMGDEVLKNFSALLEKGFRDSDVFARLGGDEFVVFMSGASENVATIAIHRFQKVVDSFNASTTLPYSISFSYGLVSGNKNTPTTLESLLERADKKMYEHKAETKQSGQS